MDSSPEPRTPTRRSASQAAGRAMSTPGGSSASKRARGSTGTNVMDTSDMSDPLAQPLPASPGPSITGAAAAGPPSEASSTSMLAPTPGAGIITFNISLV